MSQQTLEQRLEALEEQIAELTTAVKEQNSNDEKRDWLQEMWGAFKDDPEFDEVIELGRQYRKSLRPGNDE
jgi:hypothetical protein